MKELEYKYINSIISSFSTVFFALKAAPTEPFFVGYLRHPFEAILVDDPPRGSGA
jgi:hypothetical protein